MLVLLPLPGSTLQAKYVGPYEIEEKLSDTDVVQTPERHLQFSFRLQFSPCLTEESFGTSNC